MKVKVTVLALTTNPTNLAIELQKDYELGLQGNDLAALEGVYTGYNIKAEVRKAGNEAYIFVLGDYWFDSVAGLRPYVEAKVAEGWRITRGNLLALVSDLIL